VTNPLVTTDSVLREVLAERVRQDDRWGQQDHPMHAPGEEDGVLLLDWPFRDLEQVMKERFGYGPPSWAVIQLEEVFEALAAKTLPEARAEFIQVAAVAVAAVESIDRKLKKEEG
jgi:hypothetical protein